MDYKIWRFFYEEILQDFGYSEEKDRKAASILSNLLSKRDIKKTYQHLEEILKNKDVFVCGAGPSLENKIEKYKGDLEREATIAADGATSALLAKGLIPDIIVTDLDGYVPDQIEANRRGSTVVIHAHGDNIEAIKIWTGQFKNVLGTIQCDPSGYENLYNFGGFTDGDRSVFLAEHFGARRLYLIGFDFKGEIGKYSFSENTEKKRRKLVWCGLLMTLIKDSEIVIL